MLTFAFLTQNCHGWSTNFFVNYYLQTYTNSLSELFSQPPHLIPIENGVFCTLYVIFFTKNADVCIFNSKLAWLIDEIFCELLSTDKYKQSIGVIFPATSSHPHRKWNLLHALCDFFIKMLTFAFLTQNWHD